MLLNYQQKQTSLTEEDQKTDNIFVIHGLFGSLSNLSGISKALQAQHNVIAVDLRNHGDSPQDKSATYQEMASDIFELADKLNIDNFSVLGHSMGGKVAMSCALQQPGCGGHASAGAHFLHLIPKFPRIYITKWILYNKYIKLTA